MLIFEMRDQFSIVVMEEEWCFLLWCEGGGDDGRWI